MRSAPPPNRAILAAVQPVASSPSKQVITRRGTMRGPDSTWLTRYQEWQDWARRYSRQVSAASFAANVIADCCARCEVFIEERDENGEWVRSDDPAFSRLMESYRNDLQESQELIRTHAWHYQVAGEMAQTQRDSGRGYVEYGIYSWASIELNKPRPQIATVKLVPEGREQDETAFALPMEQVVRLWVPDAEWPAFAWSPMASSIEDLHRWRSLARYAWKTADSALAMSGLLWAPQGPFEQGTTSFDEAGNPLDEPQNDLERLYYELARLRFDDWTDDVTAIAPALLHWDKDEGKPEWVQLGKGLDPQTISERDDALASFARATALPVTTVMGGGVGDANHWSEWLASDKFVDSGVAPTMNRICHLDLTRTFLVPRARASGIAPERLINLRVGFDPTPIIVKPDQSDIALQLYKSGLLGAVPTLEACGFDKADLMLDPDERNWLLQVLSSGKATLSGEPAEPDAAVLPAGPGNVTALPPARPTAPPTSKVAAVLGEALLAVAGRSNGRR